MSLIIFNRQLSSQEKDHLQSDIQAMKNEIKSKQNQQNKPNKTAKQLLKCVRNLKQKLNSRGRKSHKK